TNAKDEDHRWMGITIENAEDAWVRQVNFKHFAGSAVYVQATAKRITVEDCKSLEPVSEIGGERRYTFYTKGQQTLFQRLYSEFGYHDFAVGYTAAGPNAFVQCQAYLPYSFSGTIDSWASGVLFDIVNIDGQALSFANRGQDGQGAGWTAANSVFWQCTAAMVNSFQPPTAQNWAFGTWAQFSGNGYWDQSNEHISPRSLYYAQLKERLGEKVAERTFLLPVESEASSSPSVETAKELTSLAVNAAPTLTSYIDAAAQRQPISTEARNVKSIDQHGLKAITPAKASSATGINNGWLANGNSVLTGDKQDIQWWSGSARPYWLAKAKAHITRYVPGEIGTGLTDDLTQVTDSMVKQNVLAMDHNYGLWYERRRDDHQRIRRMDGEVWPPFYEQPFARSGQGTAWDGLSKYDLTKYNKFYWSRLKQFADLADEKGLILLHQNYFQHNILEAGAHYADFPWRPANNINNTGFPEPVPYAGDKRIFMAEQFYDITHPVRKELHRAYIRQCLDNFKDNRSVIQLISAEFTGPLHFVEFWIDVIAEWEKETGKNALVALSTTKDVQDAILADKKRAAAVDIIDIRYWHPKDNGEYYEPKGGQNLAPRQ
ncbi:MAG: pectate lyase, partial [Pedobacter sp.]